MDPADREERRRQRQRGAWRGERELKNADFAFSFAGTPGSTRGRSTPARTPAVPSAERKGNSTARSSTKTPIAPNTNQSSSSLVKSRHSSKLRQVDNHKFQTPVEERKRKRTSNHTIAEEEEDELASVSKRTTDVPPKKRRISDEERASQPVADEDELHLESPEHDTSAFSGSHQQTLSAAKSLQAGPTPLAKPKRLSTNRVASASKHRTPLAIINDNTAVLAEDDDVVQLGGDTELAVDEDSFDSSSKENANLTVRTNATRPSETFAPDLEGTRDDVLDNLLEEDVELQTEVQDQTEEQILSDPVTAPAQRPNKTTKPARRRKRRANAERSGEEIPTIGITVWRPSKKPDSEINPLGAISIPSINPLDVLAQCLTEICDNQIRKLRAQNVKSRQLLALAAFRNALEESLLQLSVEQNMVYSLTGYLKKQKREQGDLRAELMRIKKEKEEVLLQQDTFRARHVTVKKENQENYSLGESFSEFKKAVKNHQRSTEAAQEEATEDEHVERVQDVLKEVKAIMSNGGLLRTVTKWNSSMESSLEALQAG
ncbi:hypothetical protein BT63DRAFT_482987 [Microthyrium microscopicum]|uniref:Inner kinetochore subunit AME1 domain-containing protein n=1 Tax=Microthyrium microscopicum TaxID=703497 RepID=A0A6A6TZ41_9PEZI|nr:hypothetical protein BT63DRAFT_482987 [Microthyrium microscopicum]